MPCCLLLWLFFPLRDLGLFDVLLGASAEPAGAECSAGSGLSNNLIVVCVCGGLVGVYVSLRVCAFVFPM